MRALFVVLVGLSTAGFGLASSTQAAPALTTYDLFVQSIVDEFGFLPDTAMLDGQEVPTEKALALLRANAARAGGEDAIYFANVDTGFGTHDTGTNECIVGAQVFAQTIAAGQVDPFVNRDVTGPTNALDAGSGPPGTIACAGGIPYVDGYVGAELDPAVTFAQACINQVLLTDVWLVATTACQGGNFDAFNIFGMVGEFGPIYLCFFGICIGLAQMFGGVGFTNALDPPNTAEVGLCDFNGTPPC